MEEGNMEEGNMEEGEVIILLTSRKCDQLVIIFFL
jgi:hypothetical protein